MSQSTWTPEDAARNDDHGRDDGVTEELRALRQVLEHQSARLEELAARVAGMAETTDTMSLLRAYQGLLARAEEQLHRLQEETARLEGEVGAGRRQIESQDEGIAFLQHELVLAAEEREALRARLATLEERGRRAETSQAEIERLRSECGMLRAETERLQAENAGLRDERAGLNDRVRQFEGSRHYRLAQVYWRARERVRWFRRS